MIYKAVAVWLVIQVPLGLLVGLMIRRGSAADYQDEDDVPEISATSDVPFPGLSSASSR